MQSIGKGDNRIAAVLLINDCHCNGLLRIYLDKRSRICYATYYRPHSYIIRLRIKRKGINLRFWGWGSLAVFPVLVRVKDLTVELRVEPFVFRRLEMFQGNTWEFAVSCTVGGRTATKCCWFTVCVPFGIVNDSSACTASTLEVDWVCFSHIYRELTYDASCAWKELHYAGVLLLYI